MKAPAVEEVPMEDLIAQMISFAREEAANGDPNDAMKLSQAALNAANAFAVVEHTLRERR